jgi:glycosyltransferase involved in cell wall biosynthesis
MSVVHLLGSADEGGAQTYFSELIAGLAGTGAPQAAAFRAHAGRERRLAEVGASTIVLPFGGPLDWRTRRRVDHYAKVERARVLLAWLERAARHAPAGDWARIGLVSRRCDLQPYKGFDALVGSTAAVRDWIVQHGWPAQHAHHVPNFVRVDVGPPVDRAELDTPERAPLLLGVGRLHASKGHDITLRALRALPDAWLWIAGSGPHGAVLRRLATDLGVAGRVRWLGWREDLSALYRTADVCVAPPSSGGFPSVVVQAWAHGIPVVTTENEGAPTVVRDGDDGLLAPENDVQALAAALRLALDDVALRYCLAERGRARAAADYSEAMVTARWRGLFAAYGADR